METVKVIKTVALYFAIMFFIFFLAFNLNKTNAQTYYSGNIKTYGQYTVHGLANSTQPRGIFTSDENAVTYTTLNPASVNASNFSFYGYFHIGNLASSTEDGVVEYIDVFYEKIGACTNGGLSGYNQTGQPQSFSNASWLNTATSSGYYREIVSASERNYGGLGLRATGYNGSQTCTVNLFSVIDNLGNEYLVLDVEPPPSGGGDTVIMISDIMGNMTTEWTCETIDEETICEATATTSVQLYDGANFSEWLVMSGVFLFLISYMVWSRMSIIPKN